MVINFSLAQRKSTEMGNENENSEAVGIHTFSNNRKPRISLKKNINTINERACELVDDGFNENSQDKRKEAKKINNNLENTVLTATKDKGEKTDYECVYMNQSNNIKVQYGISELVVINDAENITEQNDALNWKEYESEMVIEPFKKRKNNLSLQGGTSKDHFNSLVKEKEGLFDSDRVSGINNCDESGGVLEGGYAYATEGEYSGDDTDIVSSEKEHDGSIVVYSEGEGEGEGDIVDGGDRFDEKQNANKECYISDIDENRSYTSEDESVSMVVDEQEDEEEDEEEEEEEEQEGYYESGNNESGDSESGDKEGSGGITEQHTKQTLLKGFTSQTCNTSSVLEYDNSYQTTIYDNTATNMYRPEDDAIHEPEFFFGFEKKYDLKPGNGSGFFENTGDVGSRESGNQCSSADDVIEIGSSSEDSEEGTYENYDQEENFQSENELGSDGVDSYQEDTSEHDVQLDADENMIPLLQGQDFDNLDVNRPGSHPLTLVESPTAYTETGSCVVGEDGNIDYTHKAIFEDGENEFEGAGDTDISSTSFAEKGTEIISTHLVSLQHKLQHLVSDIRTITNLKDDIKKNTLISKAHQPSHMQSSETTPNNVYRAQDKHSVYVGDEQSGKSNHTELQFLRKSYLRVQEQMSRMNEELLNIKNECTEYKDTFELMVYENDELRAENARLLAENSDLSEKVKLLEKKEFNSRIQSLVKNSSGDHSHSHSRSHSHSNSHSASNGESSSYKRRRTIDIESLASNKRFRAS
ncbi:hypothetical protein AX774_g3743 [Zancudomyces culisetae]|uniref:Uncharacterized protein n=1 Tax=Zancudomyces culisetae TaxID=1213189 RepID=A0A1R1PP89_ZANCU|nr:hypothetical protein AX774_g3743 [Zancudomyces culisetae]|eukprot:OMH82774.1 hypothetical protein AX774_g3743 [Zancudomyces culisetae]